MEIIWSRKNILLFSVLCALLPLLRNNVLMFKQWKTCTDTNTECDIPTFEQRDGKLFVAIMFRTDVVTLQVDMALLQNSMLNQGRIWCKHDLNTQFSRMGLVDSVITWSHFQGLFSRG